MRDRTRRWRKRRGGPLCFSNCILCLREFLTIYLFHVDPVDLIHLYEYFDLCMHMDMLFWIQKWIASFKAVKWEICKISFSLSLAMSNYFLMVFIKLVSRLKKINKQTNNIFVSKSKIMKIQECIFTFRQYPSFLWEGSGLSSSSFSNFQIRLVLSFPFHGDVKID